MTKAAVRTVSRATSFFLVLTGLFVIFFQKTPVSILDSTVSLLGPQAAHADSPIGGSCGGSSCAEGTCEGCSGCGTDACGADNGGCSSGGNCGGY